ncbi:MAG: sensor histidine kinase [Acidimicrobiales bacterium]
MAVTDQQRTINPSEVSWMGALAALLDPSEPHPFRGPFTRWPRPADATLIVAVFAGSLIAVAASALEDGQDLTMASIVDRPAGALALLGASAAGLWWRRSHPVAVTLGLLALLVVWAIAGYGDGPDLALIIALYSVGRYCTDSRQGLATVAAAVAVSAIGTIIDSNQRIDVVPAIVLSTVPWYVGRMVRNRGDYLALLQERAERLEAEQSAKARQAVAEERSRIARELHDVVAHRVSMMTVQAGAAKTIALHDLDAAIAAMGDVEDAGRQALGELRHLLDVLRPDSTEAGHLGPQPGLADLPTLVTELATTGADVTLTSADLPDGLAAAVDLSAYRILQESFTNIVKHAGAAPGVDVVVAVEDQQLIIEVTNTTDVGSQLLPTSGFGIAGMRERATILGGSLSAAPLLPNRFQVQAALPLEPEPA